MPQEISNVVIFQGKRARFHSLRPFEEVASDLKRLVPKTIPPESYPAAMEKEGGPNLASFEKVVEAQKGESGFMLFAEFDYSMWLPLYHIYRKVSVVLKVLPRVIALCLIVTLLKA